MQEPVKSKQTPQSNKQTIKLRKRPGQVRKYNFEEVTLGYNESEAAQEASRCLSCPNPQCVKGCPVGVDVPSFIKLIKQNKLDQAISKIKEKNTLPAICGRVCPQEEQCQKYCVLGKKGDPVSIGNLERYVADLALKNNADVTVEKPTGRKVAVIGSGPAGLTVAADLAKLGHEVWIFEALHSAGGVLLYGIPEFRLPKEIVKAEVEYIKKLNVKLHTDIMIGRTFTIEDLFKQGFEAVFIGSGAGLPLFLNIPGENLAGIFSANEFLLRVNLMKSYQFPLFDTPIKIGKKVAVIGGGNVAMDAARCALRCGAEEVCVIYRRSRQELPARKEELINAEEEGVKFMFLVTPTRFIGDEQGRVKAIELVSMELGEPDVSGRRKPTPIKGSEKLVETDTVIVAIGRTPNPVIQTVTKGLQTTKHGTIVANPETGETKLPGVFTGGDVMTGEATVINAMGSGKKAAENIHKYLISKKSTVKTGGSKNSKEP